MSLSVWGGLIKTMCSYLVHLSKGYYKSKDYIYMVNGTGLKVLFPVIQDSRCHHLLNVAMELSAF